MRFNKIYILFFVLIISFIKVYGTTKTDSLYKVVKIQRTKDYYLIHARRNDSLFKIISKKTILEKKTNLEKIKIGSYYYFDFNKKSNDDGKSEISPLAGIVNNLDVKNNNTFVDGKTRIKFTKRFHYRLYVTKNLIGLYYQPNE